MERTEIHGIDFSGAADAGRKIWIASGRVMAGTLHIGACRRVADLEGSPRRLEPALAALGAFIAERPAAVFGLDFPFGIPRELVNAATWEQFVEGFPARYPSANLFRQRCREATGGLDLKRETDRKARTPFSAYNLWLYKQTYYGIRDVLRPLVLDSRACVLPMQHPRPDMPWVIEACPASTLKALERETGKRLYAPYKKGRREQRPARKAQRRAILEAIEQMGSIVLDSEELREEILADTEGDALDGLIAAFATLRALRRPAFPTPRSERIYEREGYVYV